MNEEVDESLLKIERLNHFKEKKKRGLKFRSAREESEQTKLVRYLKEKNFLYRCSPEGIKLSIGMAVKLKKQGVIVRGLPDIEIFEPTETYHGLVIELKKPEAKIYKKNGDPIKDEHLDEQREMLKKFESKGYFSTFGIGAVHSIEIIEAYVCNDIEKLKTLRII
jgi:hypothetical protein